MKTKSLFNRKVQVAFGSAILALLVVGAMSFRGIAVSTESDRWVRHTHEVLESLQDLLFEMEKIESSDRGFVLTGNGSYLDSYRATKLNAEQDEANLRSLTMDNPRQLIKLLTLEKLFARKIQFVEMVISLRRSRDLAAAAGAIQGGEG